jgi:hypothetical protein
MLFLYELRKKVLKILTPTQTKHYIWTFYMHILSNMDAIPSNRAPTDAQLLLQSTVALL